MNNVIFRGPVSANFVFKNTNLEDWLESQKSSGGKKKQSNKITKAFKKIESDLKQKRNAHREDNIKGNIKKYEEQSESVEKKLTDLSFMENAYKSGMEKLKELQSMENQTPEQIKSVVELEKELKSLHKNLVAVYDGCIQNVFSEEEVENDVVETPDILSKLFEKR